MAQTAGLGRKYLKAFVSGFFVAVPVTVTVLDRLAYVARVEGASMQPSLNPEGALSSDVVLLNRWSVRNYEVRRGDIVSVVPLFRTSSDPIRHISSLCSSKCVFKPQDRDEQCRQSEHQTESEERLWWNQSAAA
ncbi:mitochondrial inner membrane protease subunit 2 isoform X3 [Pangasianodon hypophthalmus]|uniref:mitochondrial inner membrane protease subunit 2 isoform X3 n=1 Tax=Pangasianodon hypophthalmus TaxID=310915 RepID=UPI000EFE68F3|nr:mitochondrial inner membrane protease subunit 2 isoform X3 [Pangasianodon hypophthalmus]